jgi:hypothetical protein
MNSTEIFRRLLLAVVVVVLVSISGCDLGNEETSVEEVDLEVAAAVITESLVEQSEGMFADLTDMSADVTQHGIAYQNPRFGRGVANRARRGGMTDFSKSYDPETGWHTIAYERSVVTPNFVKSMEALIRHRYMDAGGLYLEHPRDAANLNRIEYEGRRAGTTSTNGEMRVSREQQFERTAEWTLNGLASDAPLTFGGHQEHFAHVRLVRPVAGPSERTVTIAMQLDNATIDQDVAREAGLEHAVTGTIRYTLTIVYDWARQSGERQIEGTIDLAGDGQAILRFNGLREAFIIGLNSAETQRQR